MRFLQTAREGLLHLFFPHVCCGCGSNRLPVTTQLCIRCLAAMPETLFERFSANPVEKTFWGRLPLDAATAQFYFTKDSLMQTLLHQLKYKGRRELGIQLGKIMGQQLKEAQRFPADALIPLPLFPDREQKRGYNQSALLCEGMSEIMQVPVWKDVISRPLYTETQTRKGRVERWANIEGKFRLLQPDRLRDKRILLVDDVVTTGATLESCGAELMKTAGIRLQIAALCYTSR